MKRFLFLLLLAPAGGILCAQPASQRPRLGLALSGGAAKGLAHIGVLKVLEELELHPDYITGTSMGGLVGGLYAIGYPADSLEKIVLDMDWNLMLSDDIALREVIFEEKPFFKNQLIELSLSRGYSIQPGGLIYGQQIEKLLSRLTLPVYDVRDFDELPVPFHAMATDIVAGRPVELDTGSLAQALRATMAIPSVFTPVRRDSMVLVDGGLLRNFPVQELRPMGADVIIGVYVGAKAEEGRKLESITRILHRIAFMQSMEDYSRQFEFIDVYIEPDLGRYGAPNFEAADSIIARGERTARAQYAELKQLADSLNALGPPPPRPPYPAQQPVRIDRIELLGAPSSREKEILNQLPLRTGEAVTSEQITQAVEELYGTNRYQKVSYFIRREGTQQVLYLQLDEQSPSLFKGSLFYDSYHEAGIGFNLTLRNWLLPASRLLFLGRFADNHRYRFDYLKYLDPRERWFIDIEQQINRDAIPALEDGRIVAEFRLQEFPLTATVNRRFGKNSLLSLGAQFEPLNFRPTVSTTPDFEKLRYRNFNLLGRFEINTLDRNVLPRSGHRLSLEAKYVSNLDFKVEGASADLRQIDSLIRFDPYPRITLSSQHYFPGKGNSVFVLNPFAGILGTSDIPISDFYLIGAPVAVSRRALPFYGLDPHEFIVQVAAGMNLGIHYFIRPNLRAGLHLSAGLFGQPDPLEKRLPLPRDFLTGGGLSLAYDSLLGPIQLTVMYPFNDSGGNISSRLKTFLSYGYRF